MNKTNRNSKKPVLIFDMNETLLDLKELRDSVTNILGGTEDTVSLWFETMLHYSLVDLVSGHYHNFGEIGAAALMMLADGRGIELSREQAKNALKPIRSIPPFPEVPKALIQFRDAGYRMAVLTNSSTDGMRTQLENAGIKQYFDRCMSVEKIGIYKPHQEVYEWATGQLKVIPEKCLFIAAHGWDAAGAAAAGMDTAFIARPGQALYPLAAEPTYVENDISLLADRLIT